MEFCREKFKENFSATCMMFGVITVGLHYKKIAEKDLNPAMPLIIGPPECGKTRATQLFAGLKEKLIELFTKSGKILNYIFQLECCPTTSKQQWQIYIETSKLRFRSYLESVITEECSHRIGKEQASCQDVFDEVINSNIWTVAQSLRKRFPRVVEEESDGSINTRNIQEDLRGRNQKRRRSSTPKRGGLSPSRKIADISDIIQTADRRKERGRQWLYIYTEQRE